MKYVTVKLTEDQVQFLQMLTHDYILNIHGMDLTEGNIAYAKRVSHKLYLELVK